MQAHSYRSPVKRSVVSNPSVTVPGLGKLTGIGFNTGGSQFAGIPYAVVPGRFQRSRLFEGPFPHGEFKATNIGSFSPQPNLAFPMPEPERPWYSFPDPVFSESDCLNLNVSVPKHDGSRKLPVMVFIHGGAYAYGTGSIGLYDGLSLTEFSTMISQPTIVVTINYRLGLPGFLASTDLLEYRKGLGEEGVGNYGLYDQAEALKWVNAYIESFGGDPSRITLMGQSAGSQSVHMHILRKEPLFSSAILQSGLSPLCGIFSIEQYDKVYFKVLKALGIDESLSSQERVSLLLKVPVEELNNAMNEVFDIPIVTLPLTDDRVFLRGQSIPSWSGSELYSPSCRRVIIGDCKNEAIIWGGVWGHHDGKSAVEFIKKFIGNAKSSQKILDLYGIHESLDPVETFVKLEKLTSDGLFLAPINKIISSMSSDDETELYSYHFDQKCEYENSPWKDYAHHTYDVAFVLGTVNETLDDARVEVQREMSTAWIIFANGEKPWESYHEENRFRIFDSESKSEMRNKQEDNARGYKIWDILRREGIYEQVCSLSTELCLKREKLLS